MSQDAITIALALAVLGIVTLLFRKRIRNTWLNIKNRYCLNRLGLEQISNFQCPDGLGHHFNVDRLVLRHDGISVLAFKQYAGSIFCADHIEDWTQMLRGKSYHFTNPLVDLEYQVSAVSACIPNVPVNGYLVFDHQAEFPKGHPDRVIHLKAIPEELKRSNQDKIESSLVSAWKSLRELKHHR